ncbi:MAG: hypothetical protein PVH61_21685 [Candidatus Aminicenantes bacterium]|jgi:hypothetical protein
MENKGPNKENVKAIIEESLKKDKSSKYIARNFHPVYGKPYFDNPAGPGNSLKKNNNQYKE